MNGPLVEMLSCVTDCRREQAKRYGLANILRFNKVSDVADALWRNAMNLNRALAYGGT
jgi:hypothetical protein